MIITVIAVTYLDLLCAHFLLLNAGLADPYVKGQLGPYRFKTKIQKKTLSPRWLEEFMIPIISWEAPNFLNFEVCDKDHIFDDALGLVSTR